VWNRDPNQLAALMTPGLYLAGRAIAIPKLFAVPLVLGAFTLGGIGLGTWLAAQAQVYPWRKEKSLNADLVQHRVFAIATFLAFNVFFFFAGRPLLLLTPGWVQFGFDGLVLFLSTLWLQQSWRRSPDRYTRENLASRLRKQLAKLGLDVAAVLEGRSLDELDANEVYVLAKVLPDFTREKRHRVYKGVVRDALEEGYIDSASSLDVLAQLRQELGLSADEHQEILDELGVEDPDLLSPDRQRSLENQVRLSGYQRSLERLLHLQQTQPELMADASNTRLLRQQYSISPQEEEWVLGDIASPANTTRRAEGLLARLREWLAYDHALTLPDLQAHQPVVALVQDAARRKQGLIVRSLLETLPTLPEPEAASTAQALSQLAPSALVDILKQGNLEAQLSPAVVSILQQPPSDLSSPPPTVEHTLSYLANLLDHYNPLVSAAALYLMAQLHPARAQAAAQRLIPRAAEPLVRVTADYIQAADTAPALAAVPGLEKVVCLFNSDFFHSLKPSTLLALADRAEVKTYAPGDTISDAGDTCRELLILLEGEASIHYQRQGELQVNRFCRGQVLDELEVLTHGTLDNAIVADSAPTRILAVPVESFDALVDQDPDFARRVMALESQRLQQIMAL
jgi:CRP-like cAMP-binding protein